MLIDTLLINLSQALSEFKMHKSSVCWEWISACCFYNVFLLFLGSSAAPKLPLLFHFVPPNLPLLFHFVPTAAAISCPWSAGQVAAAASPRTAFLVAAIVYSVRGAVLSLSALQSGVYSINHRPTLLCSSISCDKHILFSCSSTSNICSVDHQQVGTAGWQ